MKKFLSRLFSTSTPERKFSASVSPLSNYGGSTKLSPLQAMQYYINIAPLYTAVDMTSTEVGQVDLNIKDTKSGDYIYDHPILDLMRKPNAVSTGREFIEQLSSFYLLTGNVFIVATGPVHRPPLELQVINPTNITLIAADDGFVNEIMLYKGAGNARSFTRKEVDGRLRYFDNADSEIWHIKSFSPDCYAGDLWGMSQLNPISIELDQYLQASLHNLSLLRRGARPSGALKFSEYLTDEQFQRYQQQADQFYSGSSNAGRLMLLENAEFQEMSQSNRDMDFATLKRDITNTIYSSLRIPLPLINAEFSTYDNLQTSKVNFYDSAVLPLLERLLSELTLFIMPRFKKKSETLSLSYDPESIEALEPRRVDKVAKLQSAAVLTVNELRTILGYEPIDSGDDIYIEFNKVPLSDKNQVPELSLLDS